MNIDSTRIKTSSTAEEFFQLADPRSPLSLLGDAKTKQMIIDCYEVMPEAFALDDYELKMTIHHRGFKTFVNIDRMKTKFWDAYFRAQAHNKPFTLNDILEDTLSPASWYELISVPYRTAFIMLRPQPYDEMVREALAVGMAQLKSVLTLDHESDEVPSQKVRDYKSKSKKKVRKKINTRLIAIKLKIVALLDLRVNGGFKQIQENRNLNLNGNLKDANAIVNNTTFSHTGVRNSMHKTLVQDEMDNLTKRLEELDRLEKSLNMSQALPAPRTKEDVLVEAMDSLILDSEPPRDDKTPSYEELTKDAGDE